jgi:polyvinyl alcohol dehydrogenase (cytochrome)
MTPDNGGQPGGWSGAAVWGSSPVVDLARGQVVVTTGDNYEYPDPVENCLLALGPLTASNAAQQKDCLQLSGGEANFHNAVRFLID